MNTIIEIEIALMESEKCWVPKESQGEPNNETDKMVLVKGWALETALNLLSHHSKAESPVWYNHLMDSLNASRGG